MKKLKHYSTFCKMFKFPFRFYLPILKPRMESIPYRKYEENIFNSIKNIDDEHDKEQIFLNLSKIHGTDVRLKPNENFIFHFMLGATFKMSAYIGTYWYLCSGGIMDVGIMSIFAITYANRVKMRMDWMNEVSKPSQEIDDIIGKNFVRRKFKSNH